MASVCEIQENLNNFDTPKKIKINKYSLFHMRMIKTNGDLINCRLLDTGSNTVVEEEPAMNHNQWCTKLKLVQ